MIENERFQNVVSPLWDGLLALYTILRNYFIAGVFLLIPVGVSLFISFQLFLFADSLLGKTINQLLGRQIPGIGVVSTILICILAGMIAQNVIGKRILEWVDFSLQRLPIVRSLYVGSKQISHVLLQKRSNEFKRVVLVEYPKDNSWVIGFVTGDFSPAYTPQPLQNLNLVCVFVPTTPNPTSGFLLILEKSRTLDLNIDVEEAIKIVISGGLVRPDSTPTPQISLAVEDFTIPH